MIIYVDGSAHPNPGPGGFGVVMLNDNEKFLASYTKQCDNTTNNREELKGILWCLLKFGATPNTIVYSDSAYAINTLTSWMFSWEKKGWLKSDNKVPENLDLIQAYFDYWKKGFRIELRKVKGHSSNKWNQMADDIATGRIKIC